MTKRVSAREARATFSDLLGSVYYGNEPAIIEKNGKPVAVLISPHMYAVIEQQLAEGWRLQQQVWKRNEDKDPDQVYADVTTAVQEVRTSQRKAVKTESRR